MNLCSSVLMSKKPERLKSNSPGQSDVRSDALGMNRTAIALWKSKSQTTSPLLPHPGARYRIPPFTQGVAPHVALPWAIRYTPFQGKAHKQQNSLRHFAPLRDRRKRRHTPSSHAKPQRGAKFCLPIRYPSTIQGNQHPKNAPQKCNIFSLSNTPDNRRLRPPQNY